MQLKASLDYTVTAGQQLPEFSAPEVAFIGRSNVGKSTLINNLCGQKKLARTSSTPGRTQQIFYFGIRLKTAPDPDLYLVDLPGFGYAKLPKNKRNEVLDLVRHYFFESPKLAVVCLLNDCRRLPEEDEIRIREIAFERGAHALVVLTKSDKLTRNQLNAQRSKIAQAYGLAPEDVIVVTERAKNEDLWKRIFGLIK